jgi:serine/threonine protein kinase
LIRAQTCSFGVVLYEMATGSLPFRGETTGVIIDSILNRAPVPPVRINPDLPSKLEELINKCLEKDAKLRCQAATELRADLERLKRDSSSTWRLPHSAESTAASTRGPLPKAVSPPQECFWPLASRPCRSSLPSPFFAYAVPLAKWPRPHFAHR